MYFMPPSQNSNPQTALLNSSHNARVLSTWVCMIIGPRIRSNAAKQTQTGTLSQKSPYTNYSACRNACWMFHSFLGYLLSDQLGTHQKCRCVGQWNFGKIESSQLTESLLLRSVETYLLKELTNAIVSDEKQVVLCLQGGHHIVPHETVSVE